MENRPIKPNVCVCAGTGSVSHVEEGGVEVSAGIFPLGQHPGGEKSPDQR